MKTASIAFAALANPRDLNEAPVNRVLGANSIDAARPNACYRHLTLQHQSHQAAIQRTALPAARQ